MGLLCELGRHEPVAAMVWNEGYHFSRCRHCDNDIIRRNQKWRLVPKGYRVVWKPRTEFDVRWPSRITGGEQTGWSRPPL